MLTTHEVELLSRIALALEKIAGAVNEGVVRTEDVGRARVYAEHLGEKLRPDALPGKGGA